MRDEDRFAQWLFTQLHDLEGKRQRRMSISEFARWLDLPQSNVSNWMKAIRLPDETNADKLAKKLGPEVYVVLGKPARMPNDPRLIEIVKYWKELTDEEQEEVMRFALKKAGAAVGIEAAISA